MLRWLFAWTALCFVAPSGVARAEEMVDLTRTAARHLALEGSDLFAAGDYEGARDRFQRAYEVYAAPTLASWQGRALQELGRWVEAEEWYIRAASWQLDADAPPAFRSSIQEAETALQSLRARIPKIRLMMRGNLQPNAHVRLDDREVPVALIGVHQPVDPGPHRAEVWFDSQLVNRVDVSVGVTEQRDVILDGGRIRSDAPTSAAAAPALPEVQVDPETSAPDVKPSMNLDWGRVKKTVSEPLWARKGQGSYYHEFSR